MGPDEMATVRPRALLLSPRGTAPGSRQFNVHRVYMR